MDFIMDLYEYFYLHIIYLKDAVKNRFQLPKRFVKKRNQSYFVAFYRLKLRLSSFCNILLSYFNILNANKIIYECF